MSHKVLKATLPLCLEITEQAIERSLIFVMVFPASKVSDVALMANFGCPVKGTLKNSPIDTDREEDSSFFFALLCQSGLYLALNPTTSYRGLREDEQELIVKAYCFINTNMDTLSHFKSSGANQQRTLWLCKSAYSRLAKDSSLLE